MNRECTHTHTLCHTHVRGKGDLAGLLGSSSVPAPLCVLQMLSFHFSSSPSRYVIHAYFAVEKVEAQAPGPKIVNDSSGA